MVTVAPQEKSGQPGVTIVVCDRGPGIPAELMPHFFIRFAAGSQSTGLGIGLYLARGMAEAHGGTLHVETSPGQGACFTLWLPQQPEDCQDLQE